MKWQNKGHEFDDIGLFFKQNKRLLVMSNSLCAANRIKEKLNFLKAQNNIKTLVFNKNLFSKLKFLSHIILDNYRTIVIADDNDLLLRRVQLNNIFNTKLNIYKESEFFEKYLSIFAVYAYDKVYFPSNSFICTTVCTLNCKDCLNYAPFDKNKKHYNLERLKKDVDIYLNCIDRVGLFHISGGEPFSYPHLKDLIEYINDNYREKIDILGTVTNMTILPSDELCETLKKCNVRIDMDDYTETNPDAKNMYNKIKAKLEQYNIFAQENVAGYRWNWVSSFPPKEVTTNEDELINKFNKCGSIFQEVKKGKLFACCYCEFISQAGIFPYKEDDYFDLEKFDNSKKKELVEFRLKYNKKGYVEFCKYCNGLPPYNCEYVKPAVQVSGYLGWDINNPTELIEDIK